jgi:hypothetical protein
MNTPSAFLPKLKWWHWVCALAAFMFWTDSMRQWAHSGQMLTAYPITFLVALSPFYTTPSAVWTIRRYWQKRIDGPTLYWRLSWALALLVNYVVAMLWMNGAFE